MSLWPTCFATHSLPLGQLLLDLSAMMEVPSLRVFCLESTQTLDEDPEGMFQVSDVVANREDMVNRKQHLHYFPHTAY